MILQWEISIPIFFFDFKHKSSSRSSEARTLASPVYYLSGISQALIEHADLAFSLSPNNHYVIKKKDEMASLYMNRMPSGQ